MAEMRMVPFLSRRVMVALIFTDPCFSPIMPEQEFGRCSYGQRDNVISTVAECRTGSRNMGSENGMGT